MVETQCTDNRALVLLNTEWVFNLDRVMCSSSAVSGCVCSQGDLYCLNLKRGNK